MVKRALLCGAAILFAASVAMAAPKAKAEAKTSHWYGWITDTKCGAKGASASHAECLKKCIAAGEKYALYDTRTKKVYVIDPQDMAADHGAQHVRVMGTLEGDTIHATKIVELASHRKASKKAANPS